MCTLTVVALLSKTLENYKYPTSRPISYLPEFCSCTRGSPYPRKNAVLVCVKVKRMNVSTFSGAITNCKRIGNYSFTQKISSTWSKEISMQYTTAEQWLECVRMDQTVKKTLLIMFMISINSHFNFFKTFMMKQSLCYVR